MTSILLFTFSMYFCRPINTYKQYFYFTIFSSPIISICCSPNINHPISGHNLSENSPYECQKYPSTSNLNRPSFTLHSDASLFANKP